MNRLASQTSPYLRQHQDNPVDWYPWGDDAFAAAQAEDKPILLSVGYSSCHWCHVMAHESFEDETVAAEMNRRFVNVKVDREERPDVDALYMEAVQAMTGRGGWPMTVFLAPDGRPFYGGTYYPRETFLQLLTAVDEAWRERRGDLLQQAATLTTAIEQTANLTGADDLPGIELLDTALQALASGFDAQFGGFGRAPKFPNTMNLELCLRAYAASGSDGALTVVTTSLDAMASGGIYDQLGGGFARYSTDPFWIVPHFEKMLYDQALLARIYLHGFQATGETRFAQVCAETIDYVRRDLRHPDGGFLSAEDADSIGPDGEPEEGAFYVWRPEQLLEALGPERGAEAIGWWGVTSVGNFENANVLYRPRRGEIIRPDTIENARAALFAVRQQRPRPGKDDKVLAEWNGLMLATLAEAAAVLGRADWLTDAETSAEFLLAHLRRADGRWVRSWHADGGTPPLAMAADLAALVDAFTRLAEATGKRRWLDEAVEVAEQLLSWHWDAEKGGIATIADDAEALLVRQKDVLDNATPSANSIAAVALIRLAALTGERRYHHLAEQIVLLLAPTAERQPTSFAHLVGAVDLLRSGTTEIVIPGDRPELRAEVTRRYLPNAVLAWGEPTDSPLFDGREEGHAYVCQGGTCQLPATSIEALAAQLDALRPTPDAPAA